MVPESSKNYILAIDLGTSGPKVGLFSIRGETIGYEFQDVSLNILSDAGAEQNPKEWWDAICSCMKKLLDRELVPRHSITAISVTAQWSGTVPVDVDGNPLQNAIIWMDCRGISYAKKITAGFLQLHGYGLIKLFRWLRVAGGAPGHAGKDPLSHILYIKYEHPAIYQKTYKFLEPKDYINLCLTGKFAAGTDSITLHWITDNRYISQIAYDKKLVRYSTIDLQKFPDLLAAVDVLGYLKKETADEFGLDPKVKVIMGTPDVHSAVVGSGAVRDYEGHLYLGTSSWISCHVPFKKVNIFYRLSSLPSPIPGRYIVANEQESAGVCLKFLKGNIFNYGDELFPGQREGEEYKIFDKIASDIPAGSGKVIFTPWLYGERTPVENHTVRSAFFNQSLTTTRGHLIRAVLEGVAYNSRWLLKYIEKFIRRPMHSLNVVGGGANSDVWCQIYADVLNRTIRQVEEPVLANTRGAALLASAALGYIPFTDISNYVRIKREYHPNLQNKAIYDELFVEFVNFYYRNKKIYNRLNR